MDTNNNTQPSFRTRLIAFALVLVVGFAMGWFKGQDVSTTDPATSGIASGQAQGDAHETEQSDSGQTEKGATDAQHTSQDTQDATSPAPEESESATSPDTTSDDGGVTTVAPERGPTVQKDGWYTTKDEVALYIHTYGRLPGNFISKTKARQRGWVASEGNLDEVCPGMSIGGSEFYNDEGQLPDARGRRWTECDINYHGGYRGSERIVFSNDGLIFYTGDHYETFEQLY